VTIRKVLIVDDDDDIRHVVELALRKFGGYEVMQASSGEEALERVRKEQPDVVLLDVTMPGIDGPSTLARLRGDAVSLKCPVIFLTARTQRRDVERLLELGAAGMITKPFDVMTLADEVRRIVAGADANAKDLADEFDHLRDAYARALPAKLASLDASLDDARREPPEQARLETARDLAHRLRGTTGTYRFKALSSELSRIERQLEALLDDAVDRGDAWDAIANALRSAHELLDANTPPEPRR